MRNILAIRGRIQNNDHAFFSGFFDDHIHIIDFILNDEIIAGFERFQRLFDMIKRNAEVGTAIKQDAVLTLTVDLHDGMTRLGLPAFDKLRINAVIATYL